LKKKVEEFEYKHTNGCHLSIEEIERQAEIWHRDDEPRFWIHSEALVVIMRVLEDLMDWCDDNKKGNKKVKELKRIFMKWFNYDFDFWEHPRIRVGPTMTMSEVRDFLMKFYELLITPVSPPLPIPIDENIEFKKYSDKYDAELKNEMKLIMDYFSFQDEGDIAIQGQNLTKNQKKKLKKR
jgi:hypothetical protein